MARYATMVERLMLWSKTSARVMDSVMGQVSGLSVSDTASIISPNAASSASLAHCTSRMDCRMRAPSGTASSGTTSVPVFMGNGVVCRQSSRNSTTRIARPPTDSSVPRSTTSR